MEDEHVEQPGNQEYDAIQHSWQNTKGENFYTTTDFLELFIFLTMNFLHRKIV